MTAPVVPRYGEATLAELLPSIAGALGVPGARNVLEVPIAASYLLVLVDGLGEELLRTHAEAAPFLAGSPGRVITSGVPSTTATSISMLGTGLNPGQHGIVGYSFWYPPLRTVLSTLQWPRQVSGLDVQPRLTYFERLAGAKISVAMVAKADFAGSGLTTAALRGASYFPVTDERDVRRRIDLACQATAAAPAVGYFYERQLDHAGHAHGVGSAQWLAALAWTDRMLAELRAELPSEVTMLITGDHGMINVPAAARFTIEDEPELNAGLTAIAGEGRLRHLMTAEPAAVAQRWRERLGELAWVRTREEAIDAGWFGDVSPQVADRFGDVIAAMAGDGALLTRTKVGEFGLIGMHGSLTAAELEVPLLVR